MGKIIRSKKNIIKGTSPRGVLLFAVSILLGDLLYGQCLDCYNMDFEKGNFQCWKGATGQNTCTSSGISCHWDNMVPGLDTVSPEHYITSFSDGNDPIAGAIPQVSPFGGQHSMRLGNSGTQGQSSVLLRTFQVTPSNQYFIYSYAVVLQNPGHDDWEQPFFDITMTRDNGDSIGCGTYKVVSGGGLPGFIDQGNYIYKEWAQVVIPLTAYIGELVTVRMGVADCTLGGHYGYAYVDASCADFQLTSRPVCDGTEIIAPAGLVNYEWYNELTGQIIGNGSQNTITVQDSGVYSVVIVGENNCPVVISAVVDAEKPLEMTAIDSVVTTCSGQANGEIELFAQYGYQPLLYSVDSGNTYLSTSHFTDLGEGIYHVLVKDTLGCFIDTLVNITAPDPLVSNIRSYNPLCFADCNGAAAVSPSGGVAPYTIDWLGAGTTDSITGLCPGAYQVLVKDSVNCELYDVFAIHEPLPLKLNVSLDTTICFGASTNIEGIASYGTSPYQFYWDSIANTAIMNTGSLTANRVFNCYVIDANGCISDEKQVGVSVGEPLVVEAFNSQEICKGDFVNISALAVGGDGIYSYSWTQGIEQNQYVSVRPESTTTYIVTLKDNCGSLPATDTVVITVLPVPEFELVINKDSGCLPLSVNFDNLYSWVGIDVVAMDFGDGNSAEIGSAYQHTYTTDGVFSVSLEVIANNGCVVDNQLDSLIEVFPVPVAGFSRTPSDPDIVNSYITFFDETSGATTWYWDFDDGDTSGIPEPEHLFADTLTYNITQVVENEFGCSDTALDEITIRPEFIIHFPNVFTPNNNGLNEEFFFKGFGVKEDKFEFYVFDRWGDIIYETHDFTPWDGKLSDGSEAKQDVYVWKIVYLDVFNIRHHQLGMVALIR